MKIRFRQLCFLFAFVFSTSLFSQSPGNDLFDNSYLHEVRITFDNDNFWETLSNNFVISGIQEDNIYLIGQVSIDGNLVDSIGVRQKGFSSHFSSNDFKKSLKIDFNEFVSGKKYDGMKKLNLHNGVGDPAFLRDPICYNVMRQEGIAAPRTAHTRLYINDTFWGVYMLVEQIDKTFLTNNFEDGSGNLFKNIGNTELMWAGPNIPFYQQAIELKTNEEEGDWSQFIRLIDIINNSTDSEFPDSIQAIFDVDYYLKVLAIDIITNNWDSYIDHGRNFYVYQEPTSGKFKWIPWDYNLALGGQLGFGGGPGSGPGGPGNNLPDSLSECYSITSGQSPYPPTDSVFQLVVAQDAFCCNGGWDDFCEEQYQDILNGTGPGTFPGGPGAIDDFQLILNNPDKVLIQRLLNVPSFREMYLNHACNIVDNNFTNERLNSMIDATGSLIRTAITEEDNYVFTIEDFDFDISEEPSSNNGTPLKAYIADRVNRIQTQLTNLNHDCEIISSSISSNDVVINEFVASNDSISGIVNPTGKYSDWIELYNNTASDIDLSNFYLSDNFDSPKKWAFPAGTVIRAEDYLIIWADNNEEETDGLHANFKLAKDGEKLLLIHEDNSIIDSLSFGEQETNVANARLPNGTGEFMKQATTFNANNENVLANEEIILTDFSVHPNPASQVVHVDLGQSLFNQDVIVNLRNTLGQLIQTKKAGNRTARASFYTNSLNSGIYFIELKTDHKKAVKKLIIAK